MAQLDVLSEVTGTVWRLETTVGQALAEDDIVLVVESMKMEIPVCVAEAGTVVEILVNESDQVKEGQVIARLELS